MNFKKLSILLLLIGSLNMVKAQDSLGLPFDFGMKKGKTYSYYFITQEITKNVNGHINLQFLDSLKANITVDVVKKEGYGLTINFTPFSDTTRFPDSIYSIPLRLALDTNGNVLGMINHSDYQKYLYKQIDSAFYRGEYDSNTVAQMKYIYSGKNAIENLVFVNIKEFFSIFGKQLQPIVKYKVGKDLINPFNKELFPAAGETIVLSANPVLDIYLIDTKIGNSEEERKTLTATYQSYLMQKGLYNPEEITPAVDLSYQTKFLYNYNTKMVDEFRIFDVFRLGDESKERSTRMALIQKE